MNEVEWKEQFIVALMGFLSVMDEGQALQTALSQVNIAYDDPSEEERGTPQEAAQATYDAMADLCT